MYGREKKIIRDVFAAAFKKLILCGKWQDIFSRAGYDDIQKKEYVLRMWCMYGGLS